MYKRRAPTALSLSSKSSKPNKSARPTTTCEIAEENIENDSGNANDLTQDPDDFEIPASQQTGMTSQRRFYSQRSNANRSQLTLGVATNQGASVRRIPNSYYDKTLLRCGVTFDNPQYIVIGCDHINFVNKLRTMLETSPDFPENVDRFVSGLRDYMKDEQQATKVLTVCMINVPNCDFLPQSQDSLMRNFLLIDFLETKLVELLLEQLSTICSESNPTDQNICTAILILTQLGFVNKISHAQTIFQHIVALLGLTEDIFRNEIIKFLPEILDVKKHDNVVEKIISLMGSDPTKYLNEITVNSFEAMQLNQHLRSQLKTRILSYIQDEKASVKLYPVFTKFLLNCQPNENCVELITQFRKINWSIAADPEDSTINTNEIQKEVFQFILRSLKRSKELHEGWLKSILNASRPEDCYPIDLVVLIILSTINEDRSLYLENVLRRKIKCRWMTREIFSKGITVFSSVISQHLKVFFEFIDNLFRSKDDLYEFGEIGYKLAFGIPNCDHKLLLSKLIAFVCEKNSDFVVRRALVLLQEICQDHPNEVQSNSLQILRVLDKVNDVGLFEYRLIMELLSSIAYPPPPALPIDGIASHIDILVRKQVTGSGNNIRRQGIVGSVRVVDHLAWHDDERSAEDDRDTDTTIEALEDLPDGNAKTAGNAVNLMLVSTEHCPQNRALCYDELATAFSPRVLNLKMNKFLNKPFLSWFAEMATSEFQQEFIVDEIPQEQQGVRFEKKFILNREEEYTENTADAAAIAINIAGLVFTESYTNRPIIVTLAPLFNLVRTLHFHKNNGDLESINALLGCPIIFPQNMNSPDDLELEEATKRCLMLDTFFYAANWFREVICAYASQRELNIRKKVLMRLTDLIAIEKTIRQSLRFMPPSYTPPKCHFMTMEKNDLGVVKKEKAKAAPAAQEKKKPAADSIPNNSTLMVSNNTLANASKVADEKKNCGPSSGFYGPKELYRQLDLDIMMLLQESLCTSFPLPQERIGTCLGLAEYQFILSDLILKFESVTGLKKSNGFQQDQFIISSYALIYDTKQFLGRFMHFFDQLSSAIQRNKESIGSDSSSNVQFYYEEMAQLKLCFGLTLRLMAALFSWQGFHQEKNHKLFKEYLLIVLSDEETSPNNANLKSLCDRVRDAMMTRLPSVLDLFSGVHLYHLIDALASFTNQSVNTADLCEQFLKREWISASGAVERGCEANALLNELLKGLFKTVDYKSIHRHIVKISADVKSLTGKDGKLKDFPNFNKSNFPILFRALAQALLDFTMQGLDKDMTTLKKLEFWEHVYEDQNSLLDMVKAVNIPRNFSLFLRYSQLILKLFLQQGIPMVESSLKTHQDRVIALLKSVQVSTRYLHTLCCHSKSVKNTGIIALIPGLRQSVESLNYSVKAALVANKCSSAFWLGNLKNRDMEGGEILSQVVSLCEEQAEEEVGEDSNETNGDDLGITTMCAPSQGRMSVAAKPSRRRSSRK